MRLGVLRTTNIGGLARSRRSMKSRSASKSFRVDMWPRSNRDTGEAHSERLAITALVILAAPRPPLPGSVSDSIADAPPRHRYMHSPPTHIPQSTPKPLLMPKHALTEIPPSNSTHSKEVMYAPGSCKEDLANKESDHSTSPSAFSIFINTLVTEL